ncbi:MAG: CBS domain-containing protein [Armatimonadetes bacterium]|nr:CBS domain-containing protein [Armatimonadota bacterium]
MSTDVEPLRPADPIPAAAARMIAADAPSLPVVDDSGALVGVLSEADILRISLPRYVDKLGDLSFLPPDVDFIQPESIERLAKLTVGDVMHREPLYTVEEDTPLAEAALLMLQHRVGRLPVVKQGKLVGIISRRAVMQAILDAVYEELPPE